MGDANQYLFIRKYAEQLEGPYLEVGSKDYGTTQDIRSVLSDGATYIGVDMEAGKGVDLVLDLTQDFDAIDKFLWVNLSYAVSKDGGEQFQPKGYLTD